MPSLDRASADNPLMGAGIIRYFDVENGVRVAPTIIIGITVAFIFFEIMLQILA